MGASASSLLDESRSKWIRDETEAELQHFAPYYRKQFSVARFCELGDEVEHQDHKVTQLLLHKESREQGEVLYEEAVLYFDESRKWRDRYVVVRGNYCLECHDSLETFIKGVQPRHKLLPTGGVVLTTEEKYIVMVDLCFPDDSNLKEDFAPPLSGMPGQFPVYLRLPYRRDAYFLFKQEVKQAGFLSILSDCIRHQNQDFLKKRTCEVQAFLKALQLLRQDRGQYESWDMLIGSDVRVMSNLVMEKLLPNLEKDLLTRLKVKKMEKKRSWFATVEAVYILVQEQLLQGLSALKEECRISARQQEVLIHSDMDQILKGRQLLEDKVRDRAAAVAEQLCSDGVQPYLPSVLDEMMEPISSGFQEGRALSENTMERVCQGIQEGGVNDELKQSLSSRPNLLSCYHSISRLQDKQQQLHQRFGFSNITALVHSAQIDLQQLMENAAYTFEQLLYKVIQENPENPENVAPAVEKAKHRVLKQYDHDSSSVRKRILREALLAITLPFIKRKLKDTRADLQDLDQLTDAEHSNFIQVENIYEGILLQILDQEVNKVVKEAAVLQKYSLFTDSRDVLSPSSRSSLSSPSASTPGSPALLASPASPLTPPAFNGAAPDLPETPGNRESDAPADTVVIHVPLDDVGQKESSPSTLNEELEPTGDADAVQTLKSEEEEPAASTDTEIIQAADAEAATEQEVVAVETAAEAETQRTETEAAEKRIESSEVTVTQNTSHTKEDAAGEAPCESAEVKAEAPSAGPACVLTGEDASLHAASDPSSLNTQTGREAASTTSDVVEEEEGNVSQSPESSDDPETQEEPACTLSGDTSSNVGGEEAVNADESVKADSSVEATEIQTSAEPEEALPSTPQAPPPDSIKEIRDLVEEVIEVEELVKRYPNGIPTDE
ncbi:protein Niban 1-like [Genypterus blacodes]|uniref:protein Niban 1-like n=1 Tax=Genypterus blacodes TaxID=154954 RepID=UPI003F75896A